MAFWTEFHGPNAAYALELYDRYRRNPESVRPDLREVFESLSPPPDEVEPANGAALPERFGAAARLAQAIRDYGHLAAQLDPLGAGGPGDPALLAEQYRLTDADLTALPAGVVGGPAARESTNALEALAELRNTYCASIGYEFSHVHEREERDWLREAAESRRFAPSEDPAERLALLERLTRVEAFERFLHRAFPGKFRFSLEGLDMMTPMLDTIIRTAAQAGVRNTLLGMGHRGRLNVMAHVLNKDIAGILAEFTDPPRRRQMRQDLGWTGDVQYHAGADVALRDNHPLKMVVTLAPNPSHLEAVDPVVEGMARAAGSQVDQPGYPRFDAAVSLPILIHGDAAFCGQGIVAETLNLSRVPGYSAGGTIHIIANNQLGYTAPPEALRSTLYASDMAKGFEIPVAHVNADDHEACLEVAAMAFAYRARFQRDFLIDLIGYRRWGHNEADEPRFTQPLMYRAIDPHPTARELLARKLADQHVISAHMPDELMRRSMEELQHSLQSLNPERSLVEPIPELAPRGSARRVKTATAIGRLRAAAETILETPPNFTPHPKIRRAMDRRRKILENESRVDWSVAESLAFASILEDGIGIRLTGQDSVRGTFSQRHAALYDEETGEEFIPLHALPNARASFEVRNSPLSENAAVGFEYGYSIQKPDQLLIWEAQYGDFVNGAQVILDEFLTSARAKWGQQPSLVLLLPHGYEGQGPDHSSARVERFLELSVDLNLRVANPTTAAQYFHLLRRQALLLRTDPLPLIVLTPKSLLRDTRVASTLEDCAQGAWQPVIDDAQAAPRSGEIRTLILCSGKIFWDLEEKRRKNGDAAHAAIVRVEQLYPYPLDELETLVRRYPRVDRILWAQEEPENMGAWRFMRAALESRLDRRAPLAYVGRPPSSSPAEGSLTSHSATQEAILEQALRADRLQGMDSLPDQIFLHEVRPRG
ncbi:MAG TPA: 2-oxoglutarate dehydrogenase E1 component [Terriglobia bacterium]|nr:2-oxoglutarate dehydrogenase E1 component [Terriglobia bacterium]